MILCLHVNLDLITDMVAQLRQAVLGFHPSFNGRCIPSEFSSCLFSKIGCILYYMNISLRCLLAYKYNSDESEVIASDSHHYYENK